MTYKLISIVYGSPEVQEETTIFNIAILIGITGAPEEKFIQTDSARVSCPMTMTGDEMKSYVQDYAIEYIENTYGPIEE